MKKLTKKQIDAINDLNDAAMVRTALDAWHAFTVAYKDAEDGRAGSLHDIICGAFDSKPANAARVINQLLRHHDIDDEIVGELIMFLLAYFAEELVVGVRA